MRAPRRTAPSTRRAAPRHGSREDVAGAVITWWFAPGGHAPMARVTAVVLDRHGSGRNAPGGPANTTNLDGGLENKRHQMNDRRYREQGGEL